jgi:Conjugal transfer protein TraD
MTKFKEPTKATEAVEDSAKVLSRLRIRQEALRLQASQLQARAEHLEVKQKEYETNLRRRIDAHEKIVLGALVKKAGLDLRLESSSINDDDSSSLRQRLSDVSTTYDRELILGALLWLSSTMNQRSIDNVSLPNRQRLREMGLEALNQK